MRHFYAVCFILITLGVTSADAQVVVRVDTAFTDHDQYGDVPVGARGILVGFMAITNDASTDPLRISIYVPPQGADSLCLHLISRDGRYAGRFRVPRPRAAGWLTLVLRTQHAEQVRRYGTDRLAPLAHVSRTCSRDRETTVPAGWGRTLSPHQLRLFLNPGDVREAMIRTHRTTACRGISEIDGISYNHRCDMNFSPGGYADLRIWRRTRSGVWLRDSVRIWTPDGV